MTIESAKVTGPEQQPKMNGRQPAKGKQPRVISNPNDVASLVMVQVDAVNAKKDELTIAVKSLVDTTKQLVRVYAQQTAAIQKLQKRIEALEEKANGKREE